MIFCLSQANVYVFVPAVGDLLSVKVMKVYGKFATAEGMKFYLDGLFYFDENVSALRNFNVVIQNLPADSNLEAGMSVAVRIVSLAYSEGVPEIIGEFVSVQVRVPGDSSCSTFFLRRR